MNYDAIINYGVPPTLFFLMFVVGQALEMADFKKVVAAPRVVVVGLLAQVVVLPLTGLLLIQALGITGALAGGIILVLACPNGNMVNFFSFLARANSALSLTFTGLGGLLAIVTLPLTLRILSPFLPPSDRIDVPVPQIVLGLVVLVILPVALGMLVRHNHSAWTQKNDRLFRGGGLLAVLAIVVLIIVQNVEHFTSKIDEIFIFVGLLTVINTLEGYACGWLLRVEAAERVTLALVFPVRNLALAVTIAVTFLHRSEFAVFAAAYFVMQVPLMLAIVGLWRLQQRRLATGR